jgi:Arc/MetJ-type ribon-helix-helix transcriptional regulator/RNA polymerase subunit RPABC4/transcription elongation factor Spt4
MSKITFRADDELVDAVEALDASKSEIMRDALRTYLEDHQENSPETVGHTPVEESLDQIVTRRVDELLEERLQADHQSNRDVHVYVDVDGTDATTSTTDRSPARSVAGEPPSSKVSPQRSGAESGQQTCAQCGVDLDPDHVYCPNCGEHAARTFHCECGEELHPDYSFCPGCGRRTASTEYLER